MKRLILPSGIIILLLLIGGCATDKEISEQIRKKSVEPGLVFTELTDKASLPGFSTLVIRAMIKTPKEDFYLLESKSAIHGKVEYPFVFNIGGQGVVWMAKGALDTQQQFVGGKRNPEGGEGVKYTLEKRIALKPGKYKIYIGLTEEKVQKEIEVTLLEGRTGILEYIPVYFTERHNRNTGSFYRGVRDFEVFLDGRRIETKHAH